MQLCLALLCINYIPTTKRSKVMTHADMKSLRHKQITDMAWYEPRRILFGNPVPKLVVGGEVNPKLHKIAQGVCWFQSRVLRIPDRYGVVSSGPPLLRAIQAYYLTWFAILDVPSVVFGRMLGLWIWKFFLRPRGWFPAASGSSLYIVLYIAMFLVFYYVQEVFFNPMRAPDYDWDALERKLGIS